MFLAVHPQENKHRGGRGHMEFNRKKYKKTKLILSLNSYVHKLQSTPHHLMLVHYNGCTKKKYVTATWITLETFPIRCPTFSYSTNYINVKVIHVSVTKIFECLHYNASTINDCHTIWGRFSHGTFFISLIKIVYV